MSPVLRLQDCGGAADQVFFYDLSQIAHAAVLRLLALAHKLSEGERKNRDSCAGAQFHFNDGNPIRNLFRGLFSKGSRELLCVTNYQSSTKTLSTHMCFDRVRSCLSDPSYGNSGRRGLLSHKTEITIRRQLLTYLIGEVTNTGKPPLSDRCGYPVEPPKIWKNRVAPSF